MAMENSLWYTCVGELFEKCGVVFLEIGSWCLCVLRADYNDYGRDVLCGVLAYCIVRGLETKGWNRSGRQTVKFRHKGCILG